jgi:hypothetical protein
MVHIMGDSLNDNHSDLFPHVYGEFPVENSSATDAAAKTNTPDQAKIMVTKDIIAKWSHFSEQEVAALKGKAELVNQVAAKYGLEQAQAQKDVDALLKGRPFGAAS